MREGVGLWTRLTVIPVIALAGANVALAVGFWASFNGANPIVFQIIGIGMVFIEMTALVAAADADARGELSKAWIARTLFLLVAGLNVAADFGAIVTLSSGIPETRAGSRNL